MSDIIDPDQCDLTATLQGILVPAFRATGSDNRTGAGDVTVELLPDSSETPRSGTFDNRDARSVTTAKASWSRTIRLQAALAREQALLP